MIRSDVDSWISVRLPEVSPFAVIDILVVAFLIYQVALVVRGTRAAHILTGLVAIGVVYNVAIWGRMEVLQTILSGLIPYTAIGLIVLFHPEIRRALARLGRRRFGGAFQRRESQEEIVLAVQRLSEERTGALIVMERDIGLRTFVESGVPLDARLSRDLLVAIFRKGQALHDGAVILQRNHVSAAACFLPLTMNPATSLTLGTRHRAAIGITEESDCLSIVVSEDSGRISLAAGGELEPDVSQERLRKRIAAHFGGGPLPPAAEGFLDEVVHGESERRGKALEQQ